jgi:anti-anti-sigma factor
MSQQETEQRARFTFERREGKTPGTVILRFRGPFTARDMYEFMAPVKLKTFLDSESTPETQTRVRNILDLSDVPYMDSTGLGVIVRHYARCKGQGIGVVVAGSSQRVLDLFRLTKVDGLVPLASSVEEAEMQTHL